MTKLLGFPSAGNWQCGSNNNSNSNSNNNNHSNNNDNFFKLHKNDCKNKYELRNIKGLGQSEFFFSVFLGENQTPSKTDVRHCNLLQLQLH